MLAKRVRWLFREKLIWTTSKRSWRKYLFTTLLLETDLTPRISNLRSSTKCFKMLELWAFKGCPLRKASIQFETPQNFKVNLMCLWWIKRESIWYSVRWINTSRSCPLTYSYKRWSKLQNSSILTHWPQAMLYRLWSNSSWSLFTRKLCSIPKWKTVTRAASSTSNSMSLWHWCTGMLEAFYLKCIRCTFLTRSRAGKEACSKRQCGSTTRRTILNSWRISIFAQVFSAKVLRSKSFSTLKVRQSRYILWQVLIFWLFKRREQGIQSTHIIQTLSREARLTTQKKLGDILHSSNFWIW